MNGRIPGILQEHQVTFGKKHQKEGSMMYQSFKSLPELLNWLGILVSSLLLPFFFLSSVQGKKELEDDEDGASRKGSKKFRR
jgi:hypothetical protein